MARIPMPPIGPNRELTLWEYFKPWAWGAWTAACFAIGAIGASNPAWLTAAFLWAIPISWGLYRAGQRRRGNSAARAALHAEPQRVWGPVAKWWRNRHLWFDDLRSWERRLLQRLEAAEAYFEAVPLHGLRSWLHKREIRRRIADLRYHLGTGRRLGTHSAREVRREKIQKKMNELIQTLDLEVDAAIAEDIASDHTVDQLRQVIADLNSSAVTVWEDEAGEALR